MFDDHACLYKGRVMHMRLRPVSHQFRYRVFSVFLDLDRLAETLEPLRLINHNRFGVMSFHDVDHGRRDGSASRPWVDDEHAQRGLTRPARVKILAFPRILGFVFNPLTLYYGYDQAGQLTSIVYEVKNTFGDQTAYVLPCGSGERAIDQSQRKMMYVSPFIELEQTYAFRVSVPDARLGLRIKQTGEAGETLISTLNAERRPLTDAVLARCFLSHPLMTLKVVAGIHWEALRLALKGVRFRKYSQSQVFSKENELS